MGKTLRVEGAVNPVAVLHVVQPGARFEQGVQQHALLHRGHGVHVFNQACRHRQAVELCLGEFGQREVRWRQPARIAAQAVGNQAFKLREVILGQRFNGLELIALGAESPTQNQLATIHLAVDAQLVGQRRLWVVGDAGRLVQRAEQRIAGKALVKLAKVVKGDRRLGQRGQGLPRGRLAQVAQHAVTQAFVWYVSQLLLDGLDRSALPLVAVRRQAQRISAGEPANSAAQVDVIEQGFAAVTFQLHQGRRLAGPAADHPRQRGQQHIVDLRAIGAGHLLQQLPGACLVQPHTERLPVQMLPPAMAVNAR